jgi:hypothetical protein
MYNYVVIVQDKFYVVYQTWDVLATAGEGSIV